MHTVRRLVLCATFGCAQIIALAGVAMADCPTVLRLFPHGDSADVDVGWSGQGHDAGAPEPIAPIGLALSCPGVEPNCGACTVLGAVASSGTNNRRCTCNTSVQCTADADCAGCPCRFFAGPPMPLAAGGTSVCITNAMTAATGTANVDDGSMQLNLSLSASVASGPSITAPCPRCVGGACDGGVRAGLPCAIDGTSALFGAVSYDCPPAGPAIATQSIAMTLTTGTQSRTLTASSPGCRAGGAGGLKCFCDVCDNRVTPCASNAECAAAGASVCGGLYCFGGANDGMACATSAQCAGTACVGTGAATAPNQCSDGVCSANTPPDTDSCNEGTCAGGPFETYCAIETFRSCTQDVDCPMPGDTCSNGQLRQCFVDNGAVGGAVSVCGQTGIPDARLGALFCAAPTTSAAVNAAFGLPGLARVGLPVTSVLDAPTATPTVAPTPKATPILGTAVSCQQTILKASVAFATTKMKILGKCEQAKAKGKLPPGTSCHVDPRTAAAIVKAEGKLGAAVAKSCGGADRTCGTPDDDTPEAIGWPPRCPGFEGLGCTNAIEHCGDVAQCLACVNEQAVDQAVDLYYGHLNPSLPGSALNKCQAAIGRATAKFFAAKMKALQKCFEARYAGKHQNDCPDPGDGKAVAAIARAEAKKIASITKACSEFDDPTAIGFPLLCPNVDGCQEVITNLSSLIRCVDCVTEFKVDCALPLAVPALQSYPDGCSGPCDDGIYCTTDELVSYVPEFSMDDIDRVCDGGDNADLPCTSDAECPNGACPPATYTPPTETQCVHRPRTGADYGDWRFAPQCVGGTNAGADCTSSSECPGGSCDSVNVSPCCEDDSDCDDGDPCTRDTCVAPTHTCEFDAEDAAKCGTTPIPPVVPPVQGTCDPNDPPPVGAMCNFNPPPVGCPAAPPSDCLCYVSNGGNELLAGMPCVRGGDECGVHGKCMCPTGFADVHTHTFAQESFGAQWFHDTVDATTSFCDGGLNPFCFGTIAEPIIAGDLGDWSHGRVRTVGPIVNNLVGCVNQELGELLHSTELSKALAGASPILNVLGQTLPVTAVDQLASLLLSGMFSKFEGSSGDSGCHLKRHQHGRDWPRWDTVVHNRLNKVQIKDAWQHGLRLLVVTTMGNRQLCEILPPTNKGCNEMDAIDRQIDLTNQFEAANSSWVKIVHDPQEAIKAINDGKLAIVIAIETTELFTDIFPDYPDTSTFYQQPLANQISAISAAVQEYYDKGVRAMQIVHMTDSAFAGAAQSDVVAQLLQFISNPSYPSCHVSFCPDALHPVFGFDVALDSDGLCKNTVGLSAAGEILVDELMNRGMLIDVSHASELAMHEVSERTRQNRYYPFFFSHTRFREVVAPEDATEYTVPAWMIQRLRRSGGIIGQRPSQSDVRTYGPANLANNCAGSSRSFAQVYEFGTRGLKVPITLGTDLNAPAAHARPRVRLHSKMLPDGPRQNRNGACAASFRAEGICQATQQKNENRFFTSNLNTRGLAGIELEPDLMKDVEVVVNNRPDIVDNMNKLRNRSALEYIRMWQRAMDQPLRVGPAADANVGAGPCDIDLGGLADYRPVALRESGYPTGCFNNRYCPLFAELGEECKFNGECLLDDTGDRTCGGNAFCGLVVGECVCKRDDGCPPTQFCKRKIPLIAADNICKDKLGSGEFCLKKSWCQSNKCKITFAKPYPHCV